MAATPFRPDPLMPAAAYKTYAVVQPLATHWRPATCAEVDCPHYLNGWRTQLETLTPDLREAVRTSGRKHTVASVGPGVTYLVFESGQPCFAASRHRIQVGRPPLYVVRDGDWRGNPRRTRDRVHQRPDLWLEDFAGHQQKIADEIEKG